MSLNETLDRLKAEREHKETARESDMRQVRISGLAEHIFFQRMLKDINNGMGEDKIDALIDRSVMIATKLFNKLYK